MLRQALFTSLRRAAAAPPAAAAGPLRIRIPVRPRSSSPRAPVPSLPSHDDDATSEKIAAVKARIVSPSNPRSRHYNGLDGFPSYGSGLPVDDRRNDRAATTAPNGRELYPSKRRYDTGVSPEEMPFLHHFRDDERPKPKFKSPRKRASKMYHVITTEAMEKSKASKPEVWDVPFKVGDAIELEVLDDGGVDNPNNNKLDKIRGVVLGRHNRGLDTGIYLKDVLYGEHVERKVKLHSPMVKTLRVLEEGFVNKGKRKGKRVKRAKLYYLRDRKPEETRVTPPQK